MISWENLSPGLNLTNGVCHLNKMKREKLTSWPMQSRVWTLCKSESYDDVFVELVMSCHADRLTWIELNRIEVTKVGGAYIHTKLGCRAN